MILLAVHLKSFTALALLACLTYSAEHYQFVDLHHSVNICAVITLACRNLCDPLMRLVFFGTSRLDRWQPFICSSRCVQLFLVISIELMSVELLLCFTQQLGGTTIGYALVAHCVSPAHTDTGSADVSLIPAALAASAHARSTYYVVDTIVGFFAAHLITNFGCDWSIHGCALADIEQKLRLFFAQTTAEGPRYDTYVLYYAGPTAENGDWALQNDNHLSLSAILVLWNSEADLSGDNKSRLLIISVQRCAVVSPGTRLYHLLRLLHCRRATLPKSQMSQSGRFTDLYSEYNLTTSGDPSVFIEMSPVYAVSRTRSSFQFHLQPTYIGRYFNLLAADVSVVSTPPRPRPDAPRPAVLQVQLLAELRAAASGKAALVSAGTLEYCTRAEIRPDEKSSWRFRSCSKTTIHVGGCRLSVVSPISMLPPHMSKNVYRPALLGRTLPTVSCYDL